MPAGISDSHTVCVCMCVSPCPVCTVDAQLFTRLLTVTCPVQNTRVLVGPFRCVIRSVITSRGEGINWPGVSTFFNRIRTVPDLFDKYISHDTTKTNLTGRIKNGGRHRKHATCRDFSLLSSDQPCTTSRDI